MEKLQKGLRIIRERLIRKTENRPISYNRDEVPPGSYSLTNITSSYSNEDNRNGYNLFFLQDGEKGKMNTVSVNLDQFVVQPLTDDQLQERLERRNIAGFVRLLIIPNNKNEIPVLESPDGMVTVDGVDYQASETVMISALTNQGPDSLPQIVN